MKFICSSQYLASKLSEIYQKDELVKSVFLKDNIFTLKSDKQEITMTVGGNDSSGVGCPQDNRRWDWVYDLVKHISDQPIVLDINENIVNIIFQY